MASAKMEKIQESNFNEEEELRAFHETKAVVKGLVDAGFTKVPKIFFNEELKQEKNNNSTPRSHGVASKFCIPIIDLTSVDEDAILHDEIVNKVRDACEKWGFFQVVNHGIPQTTLDDMIDGIRRFHEHDEEAKEEFSARDSTKRVLYNHNNHRALDDKAVDWRDSLSLRMTPLPDPEEVPAVCRDIIFDYTKKVQTLGHTLFKLVSEALGLNPNYLEDYGCMEGLFCHGHYYPACPEPDLAMGISSHADSGFLTVLLQNQIGGLQVLHENQWIHVPPVPGALVINMGDMLQLISNGKFVSGYHRVLANAIGPRISVACFFRIGGFWETDPSSLLGPIKELVSEKSPPIYKYITVKDFKSQYYGPKSRDDRRCLDHFKL